MDRDRQQAGVEEDDVERESHPQRVHASTAWDQEALSSALGRHRSEPEEPRAQRRGDWNGAAGDRGPRQATETAEAVV